MYTRDSALEYSASLIHRLVHECTRTRLGRSKLCERLGVPSPVLSMWLTGSRPCQLYWVIKNAEDLLKELGQLEDKHFVHNK